MKKKVVMCLMMSMLVLNACSINDENKEVKNKSDIEEKIYVESESDAGKDAENDAANKNEAYADTEGDSENEPVNDNAENASIKTATLENNLMEELTLVEEKQEELDEKAKDCFSQLDMNMNAAESAKLWDDELNSLWSRFSNEADSDTKEKVLSEQRQWIKDTEAKVKDAGIECEGGSMQPLLEDCKRQELTRKRCYVLAGYLADVLGENFEQPARELFGEYVDTQGTMEVYSSMIVNKPVDGVYKLEISIYRLTSFEGTATENNGELFFETDDPGLIKGKITIDEDDSATFVVTDSDWELLPAGDEIEFPEKWELME